MKVKKYTLSILFFLFFVRLVYALTSVTDVLWEGETGNYDIDGSNYEVHVWAITDTGKLYVKFSVNDVTIPSLTTGDIHPISDNVKVKVNHIQPENCGDVECDYVNFTLYSLSDCGNGVCDTDEDCSTCSQDCGCNSGYECQNGQCVEIITCGDGKCSSGETCEEDSCCDGIIVDLNNDIHNCGNCSNVCYSNQTCTAGICTLLDKYCGDGVCNNDENCANCDQDCSCSSIEKCENNQCVTYCGNGICESDEEGICKEDCKWCGDDVCSPNEDYINCSIDCQKPIVCDDGVCDDGESCCEDCGCDVGFECINNTCISLDECTTNDDCNDNNNCTQDICSGMPKKCSYLEIEECGESNTSIVHITSTSTEEVPVIKNKTIEYRKIKEISTRKKEDIGFVQRIINWIKYLFGLK